MVAVVCARPSATAGSSPCVGSQGLPAPFDSSPRFIFGTSDSQAIRAFRSYVRTIERCSLGNNLLQFSRFVSRHLSIPARPGALASAAHIGGIRE